MQELLCVDLFSLRSKGTIGITAITMLNTRPIDPLSFLHSRSEGEGKDTKEITGLWLLNDPLISVLLS